MAVFERYIQMFGDPDDRQSKQPVVFIYTGKTDSEGFYQTALKQAQLNNHLQNNGAVALTHIQPYLLRYQHQLKACADSINLKIEAFSYVQAGSENPAILVQALAMLIDTQYPRVAAEIQQENRLELYPAKWLRNTERTHLHERLTSHVADKPHPLPTALDRHRLYTKAPAQQNPSAADSSSSSLNALI